MAQAILISKINFIGITGSEYFHIICKDNSVIINPLERKKLLKLLKKSILYLQNQKLILDNMIQN